jgi:hypothetical protein
MGWSSMEPQMGLVVSARIEIWAEYEDDTPSRCAITAKLH